MFVEGFVWRVLLCCFSCHIAFLRGLLSSFVQLLCCCVGVALMQLLHVVMVVALYFCCW